MALPGEPAWKARKLKQNLKDCELVLELLDKKSQLRIIGEHNNPHEDLVHSDRSLTTEQRLSSETQTKLVGSLTGRC
jgi:hypothetical protein